MINVIRLMCSVSLTMFIASDGLADLCNNEAITGLMTHESILKDYNQADAVVHVDIQNAQREKCPNAKVGSTYCPIVLNALVLHTYKGNVDIGKTIEFTMAVEVEGSGDYVKASESIGQAEDSVYFLKNYGSSHSGYYQSGWGVMASWSTRPPCPTVIAILNDIQNPEK